MAIYIVKMYRNGRGERIHLPKQWRKANVTPEEDYLYAIEAPNGDLILRTEKRYYAEKFGEAKLKFDNAAGSGSS